MIGCLGKPWISACLWGVALPALAGLIGLFYPHAALFFFLLWLFAQPIYALIIASIRRGDRAADLVRAYALGAARAPTAMVLLHGFADTPEAWRREAEVLAGSGFRVIVPELSHVADEAQWLSVATRAVAEARARHNRVILWGHSMGGAVALTIAEGARPDALVLWAPFLAPHLGRAVVAGLYGLHRLLFLWPYTVTWFPAQRMGKGTPTTVYRVRRVIPTRTFAAMLRMQRLARAATPSLPTVVLLSRRETVVDNRAIRAGLPKAAFLEAADPLTSHALTNAADWHYNLAASLAALGVSIPQAE